MNDETESDSFDHFFSFTESAGPPPRGPLPPPPIVISCDVLFTFYENGSERDPGPTDPSDDDPI